MQQTRGTAASAPPDDQLAYDKAGAARQLAISVRTLEELMASGAIPFAKFGRRVVFSRATLERILHEREQTCNG